MKRAFNSLRTHLRVNAACLSCLALISANRDKDSPRRLSTLERRKGFKRIYGLWGDLGQKVNITIRLEYWIFQDGFKLGDSMENVGPMDNLNNDCLVRDSNHLSFACRTTAPLLS